MRMLVNVSNHTDAELEFRIRDGTRLLETALQLSIDEAGKRNIKNALMHKNYALYIQQCIDQAQQELVRRRT